MKVKDFTLTETDAHYVYYPQGYTTDEGFVRDDMFGIPFEEEPYFLIFCDQKDGSTAYERYCYEWSTSNSKVATAEVGIVWIHGNGTCVITARLGKYIHTCKVTVTGYPQKATDINLYVGKYIKNAKVSGNNIKIYDEKYDENGSTYRSIRSTHLSCDTIPSGGYFTGKISVTSSTKNLEARMESSTDIFLYPNTSEYGYVGDITVQAGAIKKTYHVSVAQGQ